MQMHNAECRTQPKMITLYVQHAECRMQDAESAPKWVLLHGAGCRMQNAGCKIRPKEFVRRVQLTALSLGLILHSAFWICILHDVMCGARAQKAEIWHDSYSRAQITHDHLLRSANGATRPGGRT